MIKSRKAESREWNDHQKTDTNKPKLKKMHSRTLNCRVETFTDESKNVFSNTRKMVRMSGHCRPLLGINVDSVLPNSLDFDSRSVFVLIRIGAGRWKLDTGMA
jgi:hypothetical protein